MRAFLSCLIIFTICLESNADLLIGNPCDSVTKDKLGGKLLKIEPDTFHQWRIKHHKDELVCEALKGYQQRKKKQSNIIKGMAIISGTCMFGVLGLTMSGDGMDSTQSEAFSDSYYTASGILTVIGIINAGIWMLFYRKYALNLTEPEKYLIKDYTTTELDTITY
jgi:hypothetical protein